MDEPIGSKLLLPLVLILINAFFASAETAIVSLNENRIRKQAEDGDSLSIRMLQEKRAVFSGDCKAMRLGTSSPRTIIKQLKASAISTTHKVCKAAGESSVKPAFAIALSNRQAKRSAEMALARKPLNVMHT